MFTKRLVIATALAIIVAMVGLIGCSSEDTVIITKATDATGGTTDTTLTGQANFFPLDQGFVSTYKVTSSAGTVEYVTYEVGDQVVFNNQLAYQWFSYYASSVDTSYIVVAADGVDYYSNPAARGERILQNPVQVGTSWERFSGLVTSTGGDSNFGGDLGNNNKTDNPADNNGGGIVLGKNVPFSGDATMTIVAIQDVTTSEGQAYANSYLVVNAVGDTRENRYWYADGAGLVKFEIGVQNGQPSASTGELVAYGYPQ